MEKKVPEIRFKGFDGEWTTDSLSEISSKVIEKNSKKEVTAVFTNSAEHGVIDQREYFDRQIANDDSIQGYYLVREDHYVYNPRISTNAPVGPINRNKLNHVGVMSPLYYVFKINNDSNIDYTFLDYFFKSDKWYEFMYKNGNSGARSDRFSISNEEFVKMPITHPENGLEQEKVGHCLDVLDRLIRSLELKLEKIKNIKQSLLNQMFTNGNRGGYEPLIRFKGYNDDWEVTVLGDISDKYFVSNQNIHHQNLLSLSYGKIKRKDIKSDKGLRPGSYDTYQLVKDGIIVMRFTDLQNDKKSLRVGLAKEEGIVSPAYTCISIKDNATPEFMYFYLHYYDSVLKQFYKMGDGMRQTLSYKDIEPLQIFLPLKEEQEQITQAFNKVDYIISETDRKLVKIRSFKQSLLQKMFVN